ncbi:MULTISPECIES: YdeI family stress tolerance OB fold protein [Enterobacteriaceae]|jgi:uncharacterized protein (TIGR00156 family)|uniref:YdeI family stress tolerance OB fold protein n=1 Tax=Enterobacteriaceae TaxID=543 RepID=UPI000E7D9532|nr:MULTISPECIES: YdeI family stress tolerance OB fold protein [Enterobacteriaceae]MCR4459298.1 YdeI family stress tolerance OB fold protein [Pseudescherichia sp. L3]MDF2777546.1 hypothetical protein [Enterobacteriaceae bacterium]WPO95215.1 YdeI family stress tolerance OB fold protein [Buttiauxella sp. HR94]HAZ76275.1 TIGR00156 family protein [Enterobacteriaceae bacterium]
MKKMLLAATVAALFTLPALAEDTPGLNTDKAPPPPHKLDDGYRGIEDARTMNVKQALDMHDGGSVSLRGHLTAKKGNDMYTFRDKTGEVDVYIPMAVFDGREIDSDQLVGISGSLDKKQKPAQIKVHRLQKE